jgi:hypothetical protein
MPEAQEDVNPEESSTSEQEVVKESVEQETTTEETTTQETTEQTQEESKPQQFSPVDEKGVPWVNRYHESERKAQDLINNLETKMGEILSKQTTPAQREYTIGELEQFAIDRPDQRPWVEEQKAKVIGKDIARITEEKVKEVEVKQKSELVRQQSMQWVSNHPRLQECFIKDPFGNKTWNNSHPLTQMIAAYSNDPDIKNRPNGAVIATKLALADYMDSQDTASQKKVKVLQQNLKKVQKGQQIEGGGQTATKVIKDEFTRAKENLKTKIGNKDAAQEAVKAYLKKYGVLEE